MTFSDLRTTYAQLTQMRKFATVPLKREPLTQRLWGVALDCRRTVAAASVWVLRLGYAPDVTPGRFSEVR